MRTSVAALLGLALSASCADASRPSSFGPLEVGGRLPSYAGVSAGGRDVGPTTPSGATLYVHVIDDRLPPSCLDEECGPDAKRVTDRGGHVIGASDGKLAKAFGVEVRARPLRRIVVVSNGAGRITSIVLDRGMAELATVALDPPDPGR